MAAPERFAKRQNSLGRRPYMALCHPSHFSRGMKKESKGEVVALAPAKRNRWQTTVHHCPSCISGDFRPFPRSGVERCAAGEGRRAR